MRDRSDIGWFAYGVDQPRAEPRPGSRWRTACSPRLPRRTTRTSISSRPAIPSASCAAVAETCSRSTPTRYRTLGDPHAPQRNAGRAGVRRAVDVEHAGRSTTARRLSPAVSPSMAGGRSIFSTSRRSDLPPGTAWQGSIGSLRLDPHRGRRARSIDIDWARLVVERRAGHAHDHVERRRRRRHLPGQRHV